MGHNSFLVKLEQFINWGVIYIINTCIYQSNQMKTLKFGMYIISGDRGVNKRLRLIMKWAIMWEYEIHWYYRKEHNI